MTPKNRPVIAAALLAAGQIGFLAWLIESRASVLRNGTEILLKVEPIDPRDLLRGDYVRLGYEIDNIPATLVTGMPADTAKMTGNAIVVRVRKHEDGYWRVVSATTDTSTALPRQADEVDLHGVVRWILESERSRSINVDYGIGRYYVPEGRGQAIERDMGVRPFGILAAIDANGRPQIKALMDGRTKLFQEPLY
jgi:uncharacterized membrane-anchored protein